jgi:hypothetical protein
MLCCTCSAAARNRANLADAGIHTQRWFAGAGCPAGVRCHGNAPCKSLNPVGTAPCCSSRHALRFQLCRLQIRGRIPLRRRARAPCTAAPGGACRHPISCSAEDAVRVQQVDIARQCAAQPYYSCCVYCCSCSSPGTASWLAYVTRARSSARTWRLSACTR